MECRREVIAPAQTRGRCFATTGDRKFTDARSDAASIPSRSSCRFRGHGRAVQSHEQPADAASAATAQSRLPARKSPSTPDSVDAVQTTVEKRSVWRVAFKGRLPDQPPGLFETVSVDINARTGEIAQRVDALESTSAVFRKLVTTIETDELWVDLSVHCTVTVSARPPLKPGAEPSAEV